MVDYQGANEMVTVRERETMSISENGETVLGLYSAISVFLDTRSVYLLVSSVVVLE